VRPPGAQIQLGFARPSKWLIALIAANVLAYVLELILLRLGVGSVLHPDAMPPGNDAFLAYDLALRPMDVFESYALWQPLTSMFLHAPDQTLHLFMNMLWLWWMGAPLERWWGSRRTIVAYFVCGLGGSALTLLFGLLSRTEALGSLLPHFWTSPHLGASGGVMGLTICWGMVYANETINLLFLPPMKGKTFVWFTVGIEMLTALSFEGISSTAHFGGMIAGFVLCKGWWRPSKLIESFRRMGLKRRRKKIESELRVIEGGNKPPKNGKGKTEWN
jgi:membrane associated rhomboid family serine protease